MANAGKVLQESGSTRSSLAKTSPIPRASPALSSLPSPGQQSCRPKPDLRSATRAQKPKMMQTWMMFRRAGRASRRPALSGGLQAHPLPAVLLLLKAEDPPRADSKRGEPNPSAAFVDLIDIRAVSRMATKRRKPRPVCRAGLWGASAYSPFFLLLRDQIRVKLSPSGSSNRLAKMGALKLGSSSLSER